MIRVRRRTQIGLALALVAVLIAGLVVVLHVTDLRGKIRVTAYFDSSTGIYPGDEVRILGVPVGEIDTIEPQPQRAKITFWVDDSYRVPADVKAVIIAPSLVSSRAIALTPAYTAGPVLQTGAVITRDRTMVPVEWDNLRAQLEKLTQTLQPTEPGGVSTLGAFVNTVADNLRGRGTDIHDMVVKLSQALSILGDQSDDVFGTVKNLAVLVSALHDSAGLMSELNRNLAAVTALLSDDPDEVSRAVSDLNTAITDVRGFVAENRDGLGTTSDKLAELASTLGASIDDIKQALHLLPTTLSNYVNIYQPAQGAITGVLAGTNFSNPINFICGAIQAASRLNAEQSAKLCVQYLAPIVKNRQYNYLLPLGFNFFAGAQARPNEVTFSEDWLRPDYVPPAPPAQGPPPPADAAPATPDQGPPLPSTVPTDPAAGLPGIMVPPEGTP
ncbi:MCE family protein [Mycobacterium sp. CVI_P3]|uniref:MCE family protein n=1 Tax=Mycobacterium pinniadriaticum TaxID=2994102 RepID=A0ABT3SFL8_9MYCO|nr:MCE family protein [Mycobacterium pinniadriaticum]MCX2931675.1 MCE family protein [Mycobacterium pinniadriaticum]MCX2937933.1 MCE family protein [Mycobacterium pinniadriaticum]